MKYIKPLDGLRALAVILVIISHWFPKSHVINSLPNGTIGVTVFFVLSGYLISSILFGYRNKVSSNDISLGVALKTFYWRRSLRIFPVYYLYVLFLFFYGYFLIREFLPYFLTYTSNFLFFKNERLGGTVSHLWSLAVEEQYYLIWPILVLTIPQRFLFALILLFIGIGIFTQVVFDHTNPFGNLLPFTAFDAFGLGALLAYYKHYAYTKWVYFSKVLNYFSIACLVLVIFYSLGDGTFYFPQRAIMAILSSWVILKIIDIEHASNTLQIVFSEKIMVYIGKVSYSMYLYHTIIPGFTDNFFDKLHLPVSVVSNPYVIFSLNFIVLLLLSTVSWYVIEKPINKLKDLFLID